MGLGYCLIVPFCLKTVNYGKISRVTCYKWANHILENTRCIKKCIHSASGNVPPTSELHQIKSWLVYSTATEERKQKIFCGLWVFKKNRRNSICQIGCPILKIDKKKNFTTLSFISTSTSYFRLQCKNANAFGTQCSSDALFVPLGSISLD